MPEKALPCVRFYGNEQLAYYTAHQNKNWKVSWLTIDVNDVLYRLSHATTCRFVIPTKVFYRLSHATITLLLP